MIRTQQTKKKKKKKKKKERQWSRPDIGSLKQIEDGAVTSSEDRHTNSTSNERIISF